MSFSKLCTTCDSNDSDTLCLKKTVIKNSLILPVQRQANHRHLDEEFYPFIAKKVKIFEQLMIFFDVWKIFKSRWTRFVIYGTLRLLVVKIVAAVSTIFAAGSRSVM
jgi:hypothetical protein